MKNLLHLTAVVLFLTTPVLSQDARPSPPESDDVVKISTSLIQVDVTVTDPKGKPVPDLGPDDIEIFENGKKQAITNFSFVSNTRVQNAVKVGKDKTVTVLPPPELKREEVRRTIALVVDDLNLSFSNTRVVRDALKKFINTQMQDGDLIAILRTGSGIGALQQFTNDKRQLLAAVQKIQFTLMGSGKVGSFNPVSPSLLEVTKADESKSEKENEFENDVSEFRESIFARGTLGAVNYVIRGMKDLPGRKSITLFSDGLPIMTRDTKGRPRSSRALDSLERLIDFANRSSVVIYTIDARGLEFTGFGAQDDTTGLSFEQLRERLASRDYEVLDGQEGLRYLAKQTGGLAYIGQNDMDQGIRKVLDDQSYYLVGYEPDGDTFDPRINRFNKLEVKVRRKGLKVRYRSGFFGISDEKIAASKPPALQRLYDALTSPFAVNDVSLRLNTLFTSDAKRVPFLRSFLHVDVNGLTFTREPDGKRKAVFDVVASTYGDNGIPGEGQKETFNMILNDQEYEKMLKQGLVYDFAFRIKKPGAYQMRVAVQDKATGRVGSAYQFVEMPDLKKKRLTMSGILLGNVDLADWQRVKKATPEEAERIVDPKSDTAIRRFKPATVLTYSINILNAKPDKARRLGLSVQARLFSDQKQVFESNPASIEAAADSSLDGVVAMNGMILGRDLVPGNYTLQVIVTDNNGQGRSKTTTQFSSFEIID